MFSLFLTQYARRSILWTPLATLERRLIGNDFDATALALVKLLRKGGYVKELVVYDSESVARRKPSAAALQQIDDAGNVE